VSRGSKEHRRSLGCASATSADPPNTGLLVGHFRIRDWETRAAAAGLVAHHDTLASFDDAAAVGAPHPHGSDCVTARHGFLRSAEQRTEPRPLASRFWSGDGSRNVVTPWSARARPQRTRAASRSNTISAGRRPSRRAGRRCPNILRGSLTTGAGFSTPTAQGSPSPPTRRKVTLDADLGGSTGGTATNPGTRIRVSSTSAERQIWRE
jgi:hypothetical protein